MIFICLIPVICFAQKRIGFGFEYSNPFVKDVYAAGIGITSQKIIKNFGFNLIFKTPTKTNFRGAHKDGNDIINTNYSVNYSLLAGINYNLKRLLFTVNMGVVKTLPTVIDYYVQSNYYSHFPSGPNDYNLRKEVYPVKSNLICYEAQVGYNIIQKPKFTLNTNLGYNNIYGLLFQLNFLFSKSNN